MTRNILVISLHPRDNGFIPSDLFLFFDEITFRLPKRFCVFWRRSCFIFVSRILVYSASVCFILSVISVFFCMYYFIRKINVAHLQHTGHHGCMFFIVYCMDLIFHLGAFACEKTLYYRAKRNLSIKPVKAMFKCW